MSTFEKPVAVGFIGLGVMGRPMASNILKAGFALAVHDIDPAKVNALGAAGARDGGSAAGVAASADVIVISAPDTADVEAILFGKQGIASAAKRGTVVVDCSSISATATQDFAARLAANGIALVDAPVSGGAKGAEEGTLSMMIGGDAGVVEKVRPILECMGKTLKHIGPVGAGQVAKTCNQLVIAGTMMACAEMVALCRKMGVDPSSVREALLGGGARSFVLENHAQRMIEEKFAPGFRARLMLKDMKLAAGVGASVGGFMPLTTLVAQMMQVLCNSGRADLDHSSLGALVQDLWEAGETARK
ncbi:MAG: NAD(P)-dependent oxidoreductase [Rhodospirillales bacterium]|nr:NAD(P)-dependent oxidoreductase [Rhodospirillales bacterium]